MKNKYFKFLLLTVFFSSVAFSQQKTLPKGLTEAEKEIIADYQFTSNKITPPPSTPVRAAAEWEEVEYLVVSWDSSFPNILRQIVEAGVEECKVIITTTNQASVESYLQSEGVDLTNVIFLDEQFDTIWIRDYGGNTIYSNEVGERAIVDWIYNRPRPNDDVIPTAHSNLLGLPIYTTTSGTNDLVNTGGNYMSDGMGNAFASELVLDENAPGNPYGVSSKTESEIDAIMYEYMGIENYIKMETLPYDGIHHIDMHMKLLDEETILVSEYPEGVADGPQIQQNIDYVLNNFQSPFGTPYKIKWIPAPPSPSGAYPDTGGSYRTYSNMIFVNKTVMVPTYRPEVDQQALDYLEELLPGYNIVPIDVDNSGENLISLSGAIHCISHTIGVENPLWIVHNPIEEAQAGSSLDINAMIKHNSGISSAEFYWREVGVTDYTEVQMTSSGDDNWTTSFTLPSEDIDIEYYIHAEANSGKTINRPIVAPEGYWTIDTATLSTEEWAENNISSAYPNPATDEVNFNLNAIEGPVELSVYNILGQKLYNTTIADANGTINLKLNPSWKGTLFVTFNGRFGQVNKKVLKL